MKNIYLAIGDMFGAYKDRRIWLSLAWSDISQRYRRSVIGPFWITISTALMVIVVGPLYGKMLGQDLRIFYPYLATGIVLWGLISSLLSESCQSFIASEAFIKELPLPFSLYVCRVICRNLIIFLHNLVALIPLLFLFGKGSSFLSFLWLPGLAIVGVNGFFIGISLATFCTRFRDLSLIVQNVLQIAIFVTPIMWPVKALGHYSWVAELNPLHHFMEIIRAPLLGLDVMWYTWLTVLAITLINFLIAVCVLQKYKRRISYWL